MSKYPKVFYHPKTKTYYLATGEIQCSTNGSELEMSVHYISLSNGHAYYCQVDEFYDGRFVEANKFESLTSHAARLLGLFNSFIKDHLVKRHNAMSELDGFGFGGEDNG